MSKLIALCLLFVSLQGSAQFIHDNNGNPYRTMLVEKFSGSPFLLDRATKARVTTTNGKIYQDMLVNIDLYQDLPVFSVNDSLYSFREEVKEIQFLLADGKVRIFKKGKSLHHQLPDAMLEVLHAAPLFLKRTSKIINEAPEYGSSVKTFRISEKKIFYVITNEMIKETALSKAAAQSFFGDKWNLVEALAKQRDLSFKTEGGWVQLFQALPSL